MHVVQDLITVHFYDSVPKTRGCQQFLSYFLLLLCSQHFFPSPNAPNVAGKADVVLTTVPQGILKFYFLTGFVPIRENQFGTLTNLY